jgi:hypothetical protein
MNSLLKILGGLSIAVGIAACEGSPYYTSDPIEAWVVDAETGKPIEGAVVTAYWQLVAFGLDTGGRRLRQLEVMETETDKNGRFFLPGFTKLNPTMDGLREEDPHILIFKSGYEYSGFTSRYPMANSSPGPHRHSKADGETFRLKPAGPDLAKYAFHLGFLDTDLSAILYSGNGREIPRMIVALNCERLRLKRIDPSIVIHVPHDPSVDVKCS